MKSKRHAKPTSAQLTERIYRHTLANHKAVMKQLTSIALDTTAALVTLTELNRLRVRQDVQTDRLIGLMKQFADRDRAMRRQVAEADRFMADPAKVRVMHSVIGGIPVIITSSDASAAYAPSNGVPTLEDA